MSFLKLLKALLSHILRKRTFTSYSQFGEDAILNAVFRKKSKGFYIDIGAYHPTHYSNTYALYRRGWHGVAIDPNTSFRTLYKLLRPRDEFMAAGAGQSEGTYYEYSNPVYNSINKGRVPGHIAFIKSRPIQLVPLKNIIKGRAIDFLNIDAEGADLEILKTHDWSTHPSVIAVEGEEASSFLREKGYTLIAIAGPTYIWRHTV